MGGIQSCLSKEKGALDREENEPDSGAGGGLLVDRSGGGGGETQRMGTPRRRRGRQKKKRNVPDLLIPVSPGQAASSADNFSTPTLHHLRKGKYKKFAVSGTDIPLVKVTSATPISQLTQSLRDHLNSINALEGPRLDIPKQNLGTFILHRLRAHSLAHNTRIFGMYEGRQLSCKELMELTETTESLLWRLDFTPGRPVLCLASNCVQFPALAIACHLLRIPLALVNPKLCDSKEMGKEFDKLDIQAVFCTKQWSEKAEKLKISTVNEVVVVDCEEPPRPGMVTLSQIQSGVETSTVVDMLRQNSEPNVNRKLSLEGMLVKKCKSLGRIDEEPEGVEGEDSPAKTLQASEAQWEKETAIIVWTMGRTGPPKVVSISHFNILASILQIQDVNMFGTERSVLGLLPLHHPFGITLQLYNCLTSGSPLTLLPFIDPRILLQCIQTYQISVCLGVPPVVEFLATNPCVSSFDLSSLHHFFSVAAPLDALLLEKLYRRFPDILLYNGYGLCETSSISHVSTGSRLFSRSVGKVLPNTLCKIQDVEHDRAVGARKKGEICIITPQMVSGISRNPKDQTYVDSNGWLRTGDMGIFDPEHNFFIGGVIERPKRRKSESFLGGRVKRVESIQNLSLTPLVSRKKVEKRGSVSPVGVGRGRGLHHHSAHPLRHSHSCGEMSDGSDNVFFD